MQTHLILNVRGGGNVSRPVQCKEISVVFVFYIDRFSSMGGVLEPVFRSRNVPLPLLISFYQYINHTALVDGKRQIKEGQNIN